MRKLVICIDDTDNLESIGTGELAEQARDTIIKNGWGEASDVTRHQLYVHDDIPYTSHNSSMCFNATIHEHNLENLKLFLMKFLEETHAEGADPGLCIVDLSTFNATEKLIQFGKAAKQEVLTKELAYEFARKHGIHLTEHGGTGIGVIGALAGCGLRLSGNDGRFKGKIKFPQSTITVEEIYKSSNVDLVQSIDGQLLTPNDTIIVNKDVKSVLLNNKKVILVFRTENTDNDAWELLPKEMLKNY